MSIKVDIDIERLKEKLARESMLRGRRAFANQAMADMNQFVPAKEFILRQTVTLGLDGGSIFYNTPYAQTQYKIQHRNYTTPGTGPYWDKKAQGIYMSDWEKAFLGGAGI